MSINILDTYRFYLSQGMDGAAAANLTTATVLQDSHGCEAGNVTLSNGNSILNITTTCTPNSVWLWLDPPGVAGCGTSGDNLANATPQEQGFTLNAEIKSETCVVNWKACE